MKLIFAMQNKMQNHKMKCFDYIKSSSATSYETFHLLILKIIRR